jgi:RecA-family ATPase
MQELKDINDLHREQGLDAVRQHWDEQTRPKHRFRLKRFEEILLSTVPNYLVKGIIPRAGTVVVWGPPKCGKSFWTFDVTMHIALGWKYRGRKVQQGNVVYLALEGGNGFPARKEAWRRRHLADRREPVPFYLLDIPVDLIADHKALIEDIRAQASAPAVVVIDTLNRALNGDENNSQDMARFIRAADMIHAVFACTVIIVHHCGVKDLGEDHFEGAYPAESGSVRGGVRLDG